MEVKGISGLDAVKDMHSDPQARYHFQGSEYRLNNCVLMQRPIPLTSTSFVSWSPSKLTLKEFLLETWQKV